MYLCVSFQHKALMWWSAFITLWSNKPYFYSWHTVSHCQQLSAATKQPWVIPSFRKCMKMYGIDYRILLLEPLYSSASTPKWPGGAYPLTLLSHMFMHAYIHTLSFWKSWLRAWLCCKFARFQATSQIVTQTPSLVHLIGLLYYLVKMH